MPIDISAVTAPPRKKAGVSASRSNASRTKVEAPQTLSMNERRVQGLFGLGQLIQGGLLMFGQYADAAAMGNSFGPIAQELANTADSNDTIAKPIDFLLEVGPYGALVAAVLPLGLQIAANHGWIDATKLSGQGVVPPAVLEAQMQAQMAQVQTQALRAQNEAMAQAEAARKEYEEVLKAA